MKDLLACQLPLMRTNLFILEKIKEKRPGIFRLVPQGGSSLIFTFFFCEKIKKHSW
uniref:Uncharacterized protein n=1 Tax=Oryza sativa subsp. japonica TaxID=39947 RepID=Q67IT4_ORYSJ|nr:hypothetical protein [Oryza sativa Japonica Group]BAD38607.1 hypothetical protein [Oryza sativa Japonica Group]